MHVLYLHQHFSTPAGSTGTRSYEMARHLVANGHQVTIVCGSFGMGCTGLSGDPEHGVRRGVLDGIHVIEICLPYSNYDSFVKRSLTFLKFAWRSIRVVRQTDYDVLFATSTPLTAGIPGILMRLLKPRKPFVFEVRDLWPELPKAMKVIRNPLILMALSMLERASYMSMHVGIALSPGIRDGMRRRSTGKRIEMIPNGCDLRIFSPNRGDSELLPEVPRDGLRAVFTGAHGIANGLDAVLDAATVLKRRGRPDIHLLFIGDGKLKPDLKRRARDEGLDGCLFLDPVPKTKLAAILAQMDVGLMILDNVPAFYYGTSPNKFFDYIAAGLPVLNNYPGWLANVIGQYDCGITVPPENPEAFADALIELADQPQMRSRMGQNARTCAERKFARDLLADQFCRVLEDAA